MFQELAPCRSVVKESALFIAYTHYLCYFVNIEQVITHLGNHLRHLAVFLRSLVPFRVGLLYNADQDA